MANVWSFNTTVRNPERLEALLQILSEMEGVNFDVDAQEHFFGLQIKKRFYKPGKDKIGPELVTAVYGSDQSEDLNDDIVKQVLTRYNGSVTGAGRGRTSAAVPNRLGLSIALKSHGPVVITPLGKKWLNKEIDDEELFTRLLLRWQYPNPIEAGYADFNIKPFPAVIQLIQSVNEQWKRLGNKTVGLSKEEYQLFALSLKSEDDMESVVTQIIGLRLKIQSMREKERASFIKESARQRVIEIFGYTNEKNLSKHTSDLRDYADSSLRYFRVSRLVSLRGAGRYIDIAEDRTTEAKSILESIPLNAITFNKTQDYLDYLGDLTYELPWQNKADLQKISDELTKSLRLEAQKASITVKTSDIEDKPLAKQVRLLQERINDIRIQKLRSLRHDLNALEEVTSKLSTIANPQYKIVTTRPSLDFEWYTSRALMVLNDALSIEPSYKIGDDGLPTGFRGNRSDIDCEYVSFGLTVEVTLLTGRDQFYAEVQPVMRHLRDFEDTLPENKRAYCIFVAPYIHRDTLNQFWMGNKYEFEGKPQKIVPLTIADFVAFLQKARQKVEADDIDHTTIDTFLQGVSAIDKIADSTQWQEKIKEFVATW